MVARRGENGMKVRRKKNEKRRKKNSPNVSRKTSMEVEKSS